MLSANGRALSSPSRVRQRYLAHLVNIHASGGVHVLAPLAFVYRLLYRVTRINNTRQPLLPLISHPL